ncbi:hypothetical protein BJV78DRAFT_1157561 [Lactifluus subvellereus]|nr:hypothetical protein BJV78DRAFT_1157561 [Lactifluus subvellereus]
MASQCTTINSNPDIAGIGTRINFYATIFLIALIPENEHTSEVVNDLYENSVFYGLALVLTAVIQTLQEQLDLYHAIFVMQIIFSLNFVYDYGMRKFIRHSRSSTQSRGNFRRMKVIIAIQTFTTVVFTIWLLYVWVKDSHFGSQPECNHLVKYVLFFANVRATDTWLRVLFILYLVSFTCTLLFRFIMIAFVYVDDHRKQQDATPEAKRDNACKKTVNNYHIITMILSLGSAAYGVATLELIVHRNSANIQTGEEAWGFGQIITLILLLGCVVDIVVTIREWSRRRRTLTLPAHDGSPPHRGPLQLSGEGPIVQCRSECRAPANPSVIVPPQAHQAHRPSSIAPAFFDLPASPSSWGGSAAVLAFQLENYLRADMIFAQMIMA